MTATNAERDRPELKHGHKYDAGKLRYDLLSPVALEGLVKVLTYGANKYDDWNWAKGMNYSRIFAAAQRHLWKWQQGEDTDPESGINHLYHAMCCLMFLGHLQGHSKSIGLFKDEFDDRLTSYLVRAKADEDRIKNIISNKEVWPVQ